MPHVESRGLSLLGVGIVIVGQLRSWLPSPPQAWRRRVLELILHDKGLDEDLHATTELLVGTPP